MEEENHQEENAPEENDQQETSQEENPAAKVFVGNLAFSATSEELKAEFSKFGEVIEAVIIKDKFSGRSKGFGFVTFSKPEEAKKAIDELNGTDFQGRKLTVNEVRSREERH